MFKVIPNWHPILVHFTIALFCIATLMIILSLVIKGRFKAIIRNSGYINLWVGGLITLGTVAEGFYAYNTVAHDKLSHLAMTSHRNWAVITATVYFILTLWSIRLYKNNQKQNIFFIVSLTGALFLLYITGKKGSECVFRYGIGVMSLPQTAAHEHATINQQHEGTHAH